MGMLPRQRPLRSPPESHCLGEEYHVQHPSAEGRWARVPQASACAAASRAMTCWTVQSPSRSREDGNEQGELWSVSEGPSCVSRVVCECSCEPGVSRAWWPHLPASLLGATVLSVMCGLCLDGKEEEEREDSGPRCPLHSWQPVQGGASDVGCPQWVTRAGAPRLLHPSPCWAPALPGV